MDPQAQKDNRKIIGYDANNNPIYSSTEDNTLLPQPPNQQPPIENVDKIVGNLAQTGGKTTVSKAVSLNPIHEGQASQAAEVKQMPNQLPQEGQKVGSKDIYADILKSYQTPNPDIAKFRDQATQYEVDPLTDSMQMAGANIASSLGKAGAAMIGAASGTSSAEEQKGWDTVPQEVKDRLAARNQMRQQLLEKAQMAQQSDIEKRKNLYDQMQVVKAQQEAPVADLQRQAQTQELTNQLAPATQMKQSLLTNLLNRKGIKGTDSLDTSNLSGQEADDMIKQVASMPDTQGMDLKIENTTEGIKLIKFNPKTGDVQTQTLGGMKATPQNMQISPDAAKSLNAQAQARGIAARLDETGKATQAQFDTLEKIVKSSTKVGSGNPSQPGTDFNPLELQKSDPEAFKLYDENYKKAADAYKETQKELGNLNTAETELNKGAGNPTALNAAKYMLARGIHGVGIIRENDLQRLGGSATIDNRFKELANKYAGTGTPISQEDIDYLKQFIGIARDSKKAVGADSISQYANAVSNIPGASQKLIQNITGGNLTQATSSGNVQSSIPDGATGTLKDGTKVIRRNGKWERQ